MYFSSYFIPDGCEIWTHNVRKKREIGNVCRQVAETIGENARQETTKVENSI
jgi:hypothetical protein